jgi:hypothetical protein
MGSRTPVFRPTTVPFGSDAAPWERAGRRPQFRAGDGPQCEPCNALESPNRIQRSRSARRQEREAHCVGRDDRYGGAWGSSWCCPRQPDAQTAGPPPSLRSATAVLTATRNKSVNRSPALLWRAIRGTPCRTRGKGWAASRRVGRLASGEGRTGFPPACRLAGDVTLGATST